MNSEFQDPPIEPSRFDLIVVGTGLPESILAAAASAIGKSVLQLDPSRFYGSNFASLPIDGVASFLDSDGTYRSPSSKVSDENGDEKLVSVELRTKSLYSGVEISGVDLNSLGPSRAFNLDLSGPRVLFCAESMVDLILRSSARHHLGFKSVEASFVWKGGDLKRVPDSREGIFQDRSLSLMEKNRMMRFFKRVRGHFDPEGSEKISDDDLERPFVEFLSEEGLPPSIKSIILYGIAMVDYDQQSEAKEIIKTKDGIGNLSLYNSSVGRFSNAVGSFIYPLYGQGELPSSFCRCAAVKGAITVLDMPVTELLLNKENRHYKGIRIASGQQLFSDQLILGPSFIIPPSVCDVPSEKQNDEGQRLSTEESEDIQSLQKVARAICITGSPLWPDLPSLLVIIPPKSFYLEQVSCIRALQLGSDSAVCPKDLFVVYISMLCDDVPQGKDAMQKVLDSLFMHPISDISGNDESTQNEVRKPKLLWHATYVQHLRQGSVSKGIVSCPTPDGKLDYRDLLQSTMELFQKMYPGADFFPPVADCETIEDED